MVLFLLSHRVAISNYRIKSCQDDQVEFSYRDRRDGDRQKRRRLACDEFISRFLSHILPDGFTRIRHYGFLSNRNKYKALAQIRQLIGAREPVAAEKLSTAEWLREFLELDPGRCPCCGKVLNETELPRFYVPLKMVGVTVSCFTPRGPP